MGKEDQQQIIVKIKAGAFPWVAAEFHGFDRATFKKVMDGHRDYRFRAAVRFKKQVQQAVCHARIMAESQMRKDQVRHWLLHGPGRERPGNPGWAYPTRVEKIQAEEDQFPPAAQQMLGDLLELLDPYPEIRKELLKRVDEKFDYADTGYESNNGRKVGAR